MTDEKRVPTTANPSAYFVGWGVFLTIAGLPLVLAAATLVPAPSDPAPLVWVGLLVTVLGAALLAGGAFRWAQHADRAAGVLVPDRPSGWARPTDS